jgi:hypothetical protein
MLALNPNLYGDVLSSSVGLSPKNPVFDKLSISIINLVVTDFILPLHTSSTFIIYWVFRAQTDRAAQHIPIEVGV